MSDLQAKREPDTSVRLRRLYELGLSVAGDPIEVFDRVVRIVAEHFGVRIALVERISEDRILTMSMYRDGAIVHEGAFSLHGTPCENVHRDREFCFFTDVTSRFPEDEFMLSLGLDYYAGVPVVGTDGEVIAVINAMNDGPFSVTGDDRLFLESLASRVRLELERADKATEARIVRSLLDVAREISQVRELEATLKLIVERAQSILKADIAAVACTDDESGATTLKAMLGFRDADAATLRLQPGQGVAGRVLASPATLVLKGLGESPDLPAEDFPILANEGIKNALGVPIILGGRIIGVLILGNRRDESFNDVQIGLAEAFAAHAAVAIENARLFRKLGEANSRLTELDRRKTERIEELSSPVLPIADRVLLVPIVGSLDRDRAEKMTQALLESVDATGAEVVLLDITGVYVLDTDAAQLLTNTVNALSLVGAECILTGIRAAVAQTLVHLGVRLDGITTRRRLSDGLEQALARVRGTNPL